MKLNAHNLPTRALALLSAAVILHGTTLVRADDAVKVEIKESEKKVEKVKKWEASVTAGITLTRGNSRNFLATVGATAKRTWTHDEALLTANAGYGDTSVKDSTGARTDRTTDSYVKGALQWNHLFSPQTYGGLRVTGDHDDVARLTYRATVSPLVGYYFVKQTNALFGIEVGPSYVREKYRSDETHNYIGLRIGERGEYKFKSGAKMWESLEWIPKVTDLDNYLLNMEAGISAPLSKALSVSLVLQDTYKNVVPDGTLKNDLKLIAGLTYNF